MADKYFEIAFNGVIQPGADLDAVKQKLGQMFKADEARLAHMFSGKRVFIKRKADEITMIKFRAAFHKAGAICEIVELDEVVDEPVSSPSAVVGSKTGFENQPADEYISKYPESNAVPQALLTEPLGVSAEQIEELSTDLAPLGSPLLHNYVDPPEPRIDISGIEVAPVGSELVRDKGEVPPAPPDISGLSLAN